MTQQIKFRTRVYSDCEVRSPEAYYTRVFADYYQFWTLVGSDDPNCIVVESTNTYDLTPDTLDEVYSRITPEMYVSTSRSYVKV